MFLRYRGIRTELQLDGVAGAENTEKEEFRSIRMETKGLHSAKQPWLNLAVLFAKVLRRFSRILPLTCESCPPGSLRQTEAREKQNELLNKGRGSDFLGQD